MIESTNNAVMKMSKWLGSTQPIILCMGIIVIIFYAMEIRFVPQGITIGDGLLSILVAICFGLVYSTIFYSIYSLGCWISFIIGKLIFWVSKKKNIGCERKPNILENTFAILAIIICVIISVKHKGVIFIFFPLAGVVVFLLSRSLIKYRKNIANIDYNIDNISEQEIKKKKAESSLLTVCFCIIIIIFPLLMPRFSYEFIDASMRLAGIRDDNATIYIRNGYGDIIPNRYQQGKGTYGNYVKYNGVAVLMRGFGQDIVLSYSNQESGGPESRVIVALPVSDVIVEKHVR